MSARDSSDEEEWDKPSEEDLPAVSPTPHRSFGVTGVPRDRPIFRQSSTLRYEGLPADTRAAAKRLASDRAVTPAVRKDRRSDVVAASREATSGEDPALVIEALNPHLAWLAEDRRPTLNAHVLRGDLDAALAMLREDLRRYPKNLSIARSVQVIERALIARLNHKLEPHDRVLSIVRPLVKVRETADAKKILDMVDGASTLEDVVRRSPLKRLETLVTVSDLLARGVLAVPSPLALRARRDPRVEDSNPGRLQQAAPNPVRMARLAKQLGMSISDEEEAEARLRLQAKQLDDEVPYDNGDRATLSDPIETEARAALTRAEMRSKPPPAGPPLSREEPDAPSEIRVESIRPPRVPSIESEPPITVRGAATAELFEVASGKPREESPPKVEARAPADPKPAPAEPEESKKPPSVRPSKHVLKAPSVAPAVIVDEEEKPRPLPPYTKPVVIGVAACALVGAVVFAMSGDAPPSVGTTSAANPSPTATTSASAPLVSTPAPTGSAEAPAVATIKLHIEVSPDYAKVTLDGKKLKAPFDGTLLKDGTRHLLKIEAPGHKPRKIDVVASADTNLVIALEPLPKTKQSAEPVAPPKPSADPYD